MPLSDKEKTEARDALSLALELNEPETMLEGLRRLCQRRLDNAPMSNKERDRWTSARNALDSVAKELERANKPQTSASDAESAPSEQSSDC